MTIKRSQICRRCTHNYRKTALSQRPSQARIKKDNYPRSSSVSSPAPISPTVSDARLQWLEIQPVFLDLSIHHGNDLHNRPIFRSDFSLLSTLGDRRLWVPLILRFTGAKISTPSGWSVGGSCRRQTWSEGADGWRSSEVKGGAGAGVNERERTDSGSGNWEISRECVLGRDEREGHGRERLAAEGLFSD